MWKGWMRGNVSMCVCRERMYRKVDEMACLWKVCVCGVRGMCVDGVTGDV